MTGWFYCYHWVAISGVDHPGMRSRSLSIPEWDFDFTLEAPWEVIRRYNRSQKGRRYTLVCFCPVPPQVVNEWNKSQKAA